MGQSLAYQRRQPAPTIQSEAKAQAQASEPLTIGHLNRVLKALPDKACGPDAISTQGTTSDPCGSCTQFDNKKFIWKIVCQGLRNLRIYLSRQVQP